MNIPRLIVAAPMSGSGKTTLTAGLIAALTAGGMRVAPFKVGPDYIDPTYHTLAAGRTCHNLDGWMLPSGRVRMLFAHHAQDVDLALIEGVMGLFDGVSGRDDSGSAAHIARLLDAPVLLVLDIKAMARSAAALVQGMRDFDPAVRVAGVILNRAGSERHARLVQEAIEAHVNVPVVGYLLREEELHLPERHLGLIPTLEPGRWQTWLDQVRRQVEATIDREHILNIANSAPPLVDAPTLYTLIGRLQTAQATATATEQAVIAVARDAAFNFLYADNLELLQAAGAEIVFFSPLQDQALPAGTQAVYLCGGFPELYAAELAANETLRAELYTAYQFGIPIYAECGGLMYLTEAIVDHQHVAYPMVGILPGHSVMSTRLTLGYRTAYAPQDNWLWRAGESVRGHEFHYSVWGEGPPKVTPAYTLHSNLAKSDKPRAEGAQIGQVFASYMHLHFLAFPELAVRFVEAALKCKA